MNEMSVDNLCGAALAAADGPLQGQCHKIPCKSEACSDDAEDGDALSPMQRNCTIMVLPASHINIFVYTVCHGSLPIQTKAPTRMCCASYHMKRRIHLSPYNDQQMLTCTSVPIVIFECPHITAIKLSFNRRACTVTHRCLPARLYVMSPSDCSHHSRQAHIQQVNMPSEPQMPTCPSVRDVTFRRPCITVTQPMLPSLNCFDQLIFLFCCQRVCFDVLLRAEPC